MTNNFGGKHTTREAQWRWFDSLPPEMRMIYARAPYPYHLKRAADQAKQWRAGRMSMAAWRSQTIRAMCRDIQKFAQETYGADHPDVQHSRLKGDG